MKIYFIVVLYNKKFEESNTCMELYKIKATNVIVIDNSTINNNLKNWCNKLNWKYKSMNGNKGLSIAYNEAIKILKNSNIDENDVVVLMDDDTKITKDYVEKLSKSIKTLNQYNIFTPVIVDSNNKIISPSYNTILKNFKIKKKKKVFHIDIKHFSAINTCLAIRFNVLKNYVYDEKIFLDNVDHQFFYDMRKNNEKAYVIDSIIEQDFFTTSVNDMNKEIFRKKIQINDLKEFVSNKSLIEKIIARIRIFRWKIKGFFKYKNIDFIKKINRK